MSEVKERPILFKGEMVRAILEDRKNQTRRVIKHQPPEGLQFFGWMSSCSPKSDEGKAFWSDKLPLSKMEFRERFPFGYKGHRLWVKETWKSSYIGDLADRGATFEITYQANNLKTNFSLSEDQCWKYRKILNKSDVWHPSIFMPRWASRILLEITNVRVERVQDISEEDAIAEGFSKNLEPLFESAIEWYRQLWNSINAKPKPVYKNNKVLGLFKIIDHYESFPWDDIHETREYRGKPWIIIGNPWVWVIEFKKIEG
jgi:hypothetical protein